ncbi:MAG TPA: copper chaperone PCu(A)C [Steroidobacteraceae bacterium]|nr:copper chaperone PCu(A)C [Steroidobacteraceae bacterium]
MNYRRLSYSRSLLATLALVFFALAYAPGVLAQHSELLATDAWVRVTPGSDVAAAYLTLRNTGKKTVTVVGVDCSDASMAMIHETTVKGGISRMRPHEQLVVPPGATVKLEPEGLHIMLHGVTKPLAPGASVPLVLRLSDGTSVQVAALVRPLNAQ